MPCCSRPSGPSAPPSSTTTSARAGMARRSKTSRRSSTDARSGGTGGAARRPMTDPLPPPPPPPSAATPRTPPGSTTSPDAPRAPLAIRSILGRTFSIWVRSLPVVTAFSLLVFAPLIAWARWFTSTERGWGAGTQLPRGRLGDLGRALRARLGGARARRARAPRRSRGEPGLRAVERAHPAPARPRGDRAHLDLRLLRRPGDGRHLAPILTFVRSGSSRTCSPSSRCSSCSS
jgi:hypothetical protein